MWERSPTARLIWGISLALLLAGFGAAAIGTGRLAWIAAFLLVAAIGFTQLRIAGEPRGRLWDSPLTKVLYAYIAIWGLYLFGSAAIETGSAYAIVPLVALAGVVGLQMATARRDHRTQ